MPSVVDVPPILSKDWDFRVKLNVGPLDGLTFCDIPIFNEPIEFFFISDPLFDVMVFFYSAQAPAPLPVSGNVVWIDVEFGEKQFLLF